MSFFNRQSKKLQLPAVRPAIETLEGRAYYSATPATIAVTVPGPIPAAAIAGVTVHDKIAVSVANNDVVHAGGRISITLFASLDNVLSSDDAEIQAPTPAGINIAPGHNHTYTIHVKSFPENLSGEYFILAEVAGAGINEQVGASIAQADITPPNIDLAGTVLKAPSNAHVGHKIAVSVEVTNDGNIAAKNLLAVNFSLSISPDGSSPINVATLTQHINIKPGASKVLHFSVPLALGLLTGNQYIVADVDPANTFLEANLANNVNTYQTAISIT